MVDMCVHDLKAAKGGVDKIHGKSLGDPLKDDSNYI